jgi:hypothetical protein
MAHVQLQHRRRDRVAQDQQQRVFGITGLLALPLLQLDREAQMQQ